VPLLLLLLLLMLLVVVVVVVVVVVLLSASCAGVLKTVQDFCRGNDIKQMKCGWASKKGDASGASSNSCPLCGTIWGNWIEQSEFPQQFRPMGSGSYYLSPPGYVSLACRPGRLVVRAVYKILKPSDITPKDKPYAGTILNAGGELGTAAGKATDVRRCELELGKFDAAPVKGETSKSELDAALKSAKEVNCKNIREFPGFKEGQWYSDTYYMEWSGCEGVLKATSYSPTRPWITHNPGRPGFLLAKFEVQEA
jgi:hypothetical protein